MKRTKQRADRAGQAKPEHTSGCRQFEGEDLSKDSITLARLFDASALKTLIFSLLLCILTLSTWMFESPTEYEFERLMKPNSVVQICEHRLRSA